MKNKKILIVTYYWPPSGGSGVQRWLKIVKYLHALGWSPIVVTPETPDFVVKDSSLARDVPAGIEIIHRPIWEPYNLFLGLSRVFGKKDTQQTDFVSTGRKSLFQKVSTWIRGNFFIPDARVFWVKPTSEFLLDYVKQNEVETIITTGPPHSMHLVGLRLKKKNPALTWVADFRDPWSEWDLLDTLSLSAASKRRHQKMEKEVLITADIVLTIAPYHVRRFEALAGRKVELLTNGFDEDDFVGIKRIKTSQFTICHVGVVDELRDPRPVMNAILELSHEDTEFASHVAVKFIGLVNSTFKAEMRSHPEISRFTEFVDPLPHDRILQQYGATDLQLLVLAHTVIAPGNLPGKFFEYLASGNPILVQGPTDGDAAIVLRETKSGAVFERSDKAGMKHFLQLQFQQWKKGTSDHSGDISAYSRRELTKKLIGILESA